jgi:hypothetical protein
MKTKLIPPIDCFSNDVVSSKSVFMIVKPTKLN